MLNAAGQLHRIRLESIGDEWIHRCHLRWRLEASKIGVDSFEIVGIVEDSLVTFQDFCLVEVLQGFSRAVWRNWAFSVNAFSLAILSTIFLDQ